MADDFSALKKGDKVYAKRHHTTSEPWLAHGQSRVLKGRSLTVEQHGSGVLAARDDVSGDLHTYNRPAMHDALSIHPVREAAALCDCGAPMRGLACQRGHRLQEDWAAFDEERGKGGDVMAKAREAKRQKRLAAMPEGMKWNPRKKQLEGKLQGVPLEKGTVYQGELGGGKVFTGSFTGEMSSAKEPIFKHVDTGERRVFTGGKLYGKLSDVKPLEPGEMLHGDHDPNDLSSMPIKHATGGMTRLWDNKHGEFAKDADGKVLSFDKPADADAAIKRFKNQRWGA